MKKFLFILAFILIPFTLLYAGAVRETKYVYVGSGNVLAHVGPTRLWAVHGWTTSSTGVISVYDAADTDDTGTSTLMITLKEATDATTMQGILNGMRAWAGLYVNLTNASCVLEIDME